MVIPARQVSMPGVVLVYPVEGRVQVVPAPFIRYVVCFYTPLHVSPVLPWLPWVSRSYDT